MYRKTKFLAKLGLVLIKRLMSSVRVSVCFFILINLFSFSSMGQKRTIDSLDALLVKAPQNHKKADILNELSSQLSVTEPQRSKEMAEQALALSISIDYGQGIGFAKLRLGRYYDLQSIYDSAFLHYEQALALGEKHSDSLVIAQALIRIGNTYRYQGNYDLALKNLKSALTIIELSVFTYWEAYALNIIGLVHQQQGRYDEALEASSRALEIRQSLGVKLDIASSLGNVGLVYDYKGEFETALKYYYEALDLNMQIGEQHGAAINWNNIGIVYGFQGDSDKSLAAFEEALALHTKTGNKRYMAGTLRNIGEHYYHSGQYVKAQEVYQAVLDVYEKIGDVSGKANTMISIADLFLLQKRPDQAKAYYQGALSIYTDSGDQAGMATAYESLGAVSFKKADFDSALLLHQNALTIRKNIDYKEGIAQSHKGIANAQLSKANYQLARENYQQALELAKTVGLKSVEISALNGLAKVCIETNDYAKALHLSKKSLQLLGEVSDNKKLRLEVHENLSKIYSNTGQYQLAFESQKAFTLLKDSLFNTDISKQLSELQVQYETARKEKLISDQQYEISLLEAANTYRMRLLWIGGASLLFLFGLIMVARSRAFAMRSKNMQKQYTQMLLTSHEDERKRISRDLHDSVGQSLMLIKNKIILDQDEETVSMVSQALEEVRTISKALHPALLEELGLTASIDKLVAEFDEHTDIFFTVENDNIDEIFPQDIELHIFRIVQEAINNMVKHAQTASALIKITNESSKVIISIKDFGVGFDLSEQDLSNSLGMKTLKERTQIINGKIAIDSIKSVGTTVLVEIPKVTTQ